MNCPTGRSSGRADQRFFFGWRSVARPSAVALDTKVEAMDPRVSRLKTLVECANFAKNARDRGAPELADQARRRAVELRAEAHGVTSEIERECLQAVYAYEEVLSAQKGKRQPASRTWQMIRRHGILPAVERVVARKEESSGYTALVEMGLTDFAFEAVILRHPEAFSPEAVARSKARMPEQNGV